MTGTPTDGPPTSGPGDEPTAPPPSTAPTPVVPESVVPESGPPSWSTEPQSVWSPPPTPSGWSAPAPDSAPGSGWASPPAWGSAPQGWPPPPGAPMAPPPTAPTAPPNGPVTPPAIPAAGAGGGGSWNYGYGGMMWSPPPEPQRAPNATRRVVATIAIVTLVLFSGAIGAIISSAVNHPSSTSPSAAPFIGGSNNNGSGGSGLGNGFGTAPSTGNSGTSSVPTAITSKVNPALVNIYTTIDTGDGSGEAAGTGMVITSSGEVLTNNHVIADATTVRVELVADGSTHSAKVLGYDVKDDVALLKISGVSDLDTVTFADATKVAIGDAVYAIGNAGGRGGTPSSSAGSVTALDQKVTAGDEGTGSSETLTGMIEISAPIEPGDSGGALVNSKGQIIGMNTAAATNDRFGDQTGSTTAFAIPINRAQQLVKQIEAQEDSANVHIGERGLLGVRVEDLATQVTCPNVSAGSGALVAGVESDSPAGTAGLGACDVIVSVGGKTVASTSDLNAAMFPYHPGQTVSVGWVDTSGHSQQADLQLIAGPPT